MSKKIMIIILILLLLLLTVFAIKTMFKKKEIIKNLYSMHYSYSTGTMIYSQVRYDLSYKDGEYFLEIKPDGVSDEETKSIAVSKNTVEKIESILNKYNVTKWDGFNKSDKYVLDGNSFSFSIGYGDNKSVYAHGYMMYPDNYREVRDELETIFNSL